jgi:16S rRNA (cytosine1402-N4)-methyltransferase
MDADVVGHIPVLAGQVVEVLQPRPGAVVLDATIGRGGHAERLIPRLSAGGRYVGLDLDAGNADFARSRLTPVAENVGVTLTVLHAGFQDAAAVLADLHLDGVDGLLADLGFASNQMDDRARGLTFRDDGPLDMRLDTAATTTAADLVNRLPERELADLIYGYGEERLSRKIARKIADRRAISPIQSTSELAELVHRAYGPRARSQKIHPATRTFMALRIAVNDELGNLERLLDDLPNLLKPGGRAAIISFHSLEDRRVKQRFAELDHRGVGRRLTRKPVVADDAETADNPRSRSAKLRGFERAIDGSATDARE